MRRFIDESVHLAEGSANPALASETEAPVLACSTGPVHGHQQALGDGGAVGNGDEGTWAFVPQLFLPGSGPWIERAE